MFKTRVNVIYSKHSIHWYIGGLMILTNLKLPLTTLNILYAKDLKTPAKKKWKSDNENPRIVLTILKKNNGDGKIYYRELSNRKLIAS